MARPIIRLPAQQSSWWNFDPKGTASGSLALFIKKPAAVWPLPYFGGSKQIIWSPVETNSLSDPGHCCLFLFPPLAQPGVPATRWTKDGNAYYQVEKGDCPGGLPALSKTTVISKES